MSEMTRTAKAHLRITTHISLKLKRRPGRRTITEELEFANGSTPDNTVDFCINAPLLQGLARAFYWQRLLDTGEIKSGTEIAHLEGRNPSTVNELLRITLLDPSLVQSILKGVQPKELSMKRFTRNAIPELWQKQD